MYLEETDVEWMYKERGDMMTEAEWESCSNKSRNGDNCQKLEDKVYSHASTLLSDTWPSEL